MSTFTNSEQLYGVSLKTIQSGVYVNVTSGGGVFFGLTTFVASGALLSGGPSLSGSVVTVYNAVSGVTNPWGSGGGILYYFNFGSHSGLGTAGVQALAPDQWYPVPFQSGLNVGISGTATTVLGLTLSFRNGI